MDEVQSMDQVPLKNILAWYRSINSTLKCRPAWEKMFGGAKLGKSSDTTLWRNERWIKEVGLEVLDDLAKNNRGITLAQAHKEYSEWDRIVKGQGSTNSKRKLGKGEGQKAPKKRAKTEELTAAERALDPESDSDIEIHRS